MGPNLMKLPTELPTWASTLECERQMRVINQYNIAGARDKRLAFLKEQQTKMFFCFFGSLAAAVRHG